MQMCAFRRQTTHSIEISDRREIVAWRHLCNLKETMHNE